MAKRGIDIRFREDVREISFLFPPELHAAILELQENQPQRVVRLASIPIPVSAPAPKIEAHLADGSDFGTYLHLIQPFVSLYREKELPLREMARAKKKAIFRDPAYAALLKRLSEGYSVVQLKKVAAAASVEDPMFALSSFIDIAVDQGLVVPISVAHMEPSSGAMTYFRAYRHGEETYIHERDIALFHMMLMEVKKSLLDGLRGTSVTQSLPTLKAGNLPKLVLEKVLVLFLRYCIGEGIFNQAFTRGSFNRGAIKLSVGRDLMGARVAVGEHGPTELLPEDTFVAWLKRRKVVQLTTKQGYQIPDAAETEGVNPREIDARSAREARIFGTVVGFGISRLLVAENKASAARGARRGVEAPESAPSAVLNDTLVEMTTCESASSTLLAVGAEFRRFASVAEQVLGGPSAPSDFVLASENWLFRTVLIRAVNSAYMKIIAYLFGQAAASARYMASLLQESGGINSEIWQRIWETSAKATARAQEALEHRKLLEYAAVVVPLMLDIFMTEYVALALSGKTAGQVARKQMLLKIVSQHIEDLQRRASECLQRKTTFHQGFGSLLSNVAATYSARWKQFSESPRAPDFDLLLRQLRDGQLRAIEGYEWLDKAFRAQGKLSALVEYEQVMEICLDLTDAEWEAFGPGVGASLSTVSAQCAKGKGPGGKPLEGIPNEQLGNLWIPELPQQGKSTFRILMNGPLGALWAGHLVGKLLTHLRDLSNRPSAISVVAFLGLEHARKIYRVAATAEQIVANSLAQAIEESLTSLRNNAEILMIVSDMDHNAVATRAFVKGMSELMKGQTPHPAFAGPKMIPELSATMQVQTFANPDANRVHLLPPDFKLGWVFIVPDEGIALVDILDQLKIQTRRRKKDAWILLEFSFDTPSGTIHCSAMQPSGQGNPKVAVTLGELRAHVRELDMIAVVGICASLSPKQKLREVLIPTGVLDTQLGMQLPGGRKPRSEGHPIRQAELQMIHAFLVERGRAKSSIPSRGKFKVDSGVMVSDNDLLRNEDPAQYHRQMAAAYSDKADAYDMETAGVFNWARETSGAPLTFVLKGRADLGNFAKADDDNRLAAARNAVFATMQLAGFAVQIKKLADN